MMWAVMLALCAPADGAKDKPDAEIARLQGAWVVVLTEHDGKVIPAKSNEKITLTFSGERLRWVNVVYKEGGATAGFVNYTVSVAPAGGVQGIDLTQTDEHAKGRRTLGVYRIEGDRLTLCLGEFGGDKRPADFDTTGKARTVFLVLKKQVDR